MAADGGSALIQGFLGRLSPEESDALELVARRRVFAKGTALFVEGESSDRIIVLTSGRAKVSFYTEDGREIVLGIRIPGDILGELSAIDGEPRSATVTALEKTGALVVAASDFKSLLEQHPRIALVMLEMLVAKLRDADRKRVEFAAYDTEGRIARRLVELAERFGTETEDGIDIAVQLSQDDLAGWAGCSREAAAKALAALRRKGFITTRRRGITVIDSQGLARRAS